jgi:hypothetical protein
MTMLAAMIGIMGYPHANQTVTVTVGVEPGKIYFTYGYSLAIGIGSVSPSTFTALNAAINSIVWVSSSDLLTFSVAGSHSNFGWSTMTVAGVTYKRADAIFASSDTATSWSWSTATNPFPTSGANVPVVFT